MSIEQTRVAHPDLPLAAPDFGHGLYDTALRDRHIELRRKFTEAGENALCDGEILELLLLHSTPRGDTRDSARALLESFGTLGDVVSADRARLEAIVGPVAASDLRLMSALSKRLAYKNIEHRPLISSWDAVIDYCRAGIAHAPKEVFHVLFLNRANRLIADECMGTGTVDHVPVYPREILKRALELNACALILVHNHPSGDAAPSQSDIAMTRQIITAAEALCVTVHDHLIISAQSEFSMASEGML